MWQLTVSLCHTCCKEDCRAVRVIRCESEKDHFAFSSKHQFCKLASTLVALARRVHVKKLVQKKQYRTRDINNRGFYYLFILSHVGFSLMIGGIPLKLLQLLNKSGYYQREANNGTSMVTNN